MTPNVAPGDRLVRAVAASAMLVVAAVAGIGTTDGLMMLLLAVAIAATALTARCPLYALYGFSTVGGPHRTRSCSIEGDSSLCHTEAARPRPRADERP